jgi:hypothetical protein
MQARTSVKIPLIPSIVAAAIVAGLIFWFFYMSRPAPHPELQPASAEELAYAPKVVLANLTMKAAENFMQQRVVEVRGDILNAGGRALDAVYVDCTFTGIDGRQVYRERQAAFLSKTNPLKPGETRPFRLAFDHLPDNWNQAMPALAVAKLGFAD